MKAIASCLLALTALPAFAQMPPQMQIDKPVSQAAPAADERLGTVSFATSCSPAVEASFNRGIALLHDFWYEEAQRQFEQIAKSDPSCSMAHWGIAMSQFHQIWNRPDESVMKVGREQMDMAKSPAAETGRERAYVSALSGFFQPGNEEFPPRMAAYSAAMGKLYAEYPNDVDAGAFYALSLLAAESPDDTSLAQEHKAMAVLKPLFAKDPDNPGVVHYIIHSCDNPAMAADGLAASDHYGEIAEAGAHAFHMPGHIYARLGLWPQDAASQLGSIAASEAAEARGRSGLMDEPHSYDFLLYAYLQSGQDGAAKNALARSSAALAKIAAMPDMGARHMDGMVAYYRIEYAAIYALEMRDWKSAAAIEPSSNAAAEASTHAYWARSVAFGHLREPAQAQANLAKFDSLIAEIKKGKRAYLAEGAGRQIERNEMLAWVAFAAGKQDDSLRRMREAADLQDQVGQGEVDIPAREMLADMLLEYNQPRQALAEYEVSLKLSPNRFNGLYNAGLAAEAAGDKAKAHQFYAALLQSTDNGDRSERPEFAHVKSFVSSTQVAAK